MRLRDFLEVEIKDVTYLIPVDERVHTSIMDYEGDITFGEVVNIYPHSIVVEDLRTGSTKEVEFNNIYNISFSENVI